MTVYKVILFFCVVLNDLIFVIVLSVYKTICPDSINHAMSFFFLDCPQCYNLVQRQVSAHRAKLRELAILINKTADNPTLFNDSEFISYLQRVNSSINVLLRDARDTSCKHLYNNTYMKSHSNDVIVARLLL